MICNTTPGVWVPGEARHNVATVLQEIKKHEQKLLKCSNKDVKFIMTQ